MNRITALIIGVAAATMAVPTPAAATGEPAAVATEAPAAAVPLLEQAQAAAAAVQPAVSAPDGGNGQSVGPMLLAIHGVTAVLLYADTAHGERKNTVGILTMAGASAAVALIATAFD